MKRIVILYLVCIMLSCFDLITHIPCGPTSCDNVGYESCVRPPEVRTEEDSLCYSCEDLARYGDPCDPANTREGCVLYCIDKAVEKKEQIWNQTQESHNRTSQRLVLEKDSTISLLRKNATEHARKLEYANKITQMYRGLFIAALLTLCMTLAIVIFVYCKKSHYKSVETYESRLTHPTAYSKAVSESEEPKSIPNSSCSVESKNITNTDSRVIKQEKHPVKCRDDRLNNVPPQQDDSGVMCT